MVETCLWDTVPTKNLAPSQAVLCFPNLFAVRDHHYHIVSSPGFLLLYGGFFSSFFCLQIKFYLWAWKLLHNLMLSWGKSNFLIMSNSFLLELEMSFFPSNSENSIFFFSKCNVIKIPHDINLNAFSRFISSMQVEKSHTHHCWMPVVPSLSMAVLLCC